MGIIKKKDKNKLKIDLHFINFLNRIKVFRLIKIRFCE